MSKGRTGAELDAARSLTLKELTRLPPLRTIAIIDDVQRDADHIAALLRLLLGHQISIRYYGSIPAMLLHCRSNPPDLIFLDDHLPPLDRAETSIPALRRFNVDAPIVIISGALTRARQTQLKHLSPLGFLDKDAVNTSALAETLLKLLPP